VNAHSYTHTCETYHTQCSPIYQNQDPEPLKHHDTGNGYLHNDHTQHMVGNYSNPAFVISIQLARMKIDTRTIDSVVLHILNYSVIIRDAG